MLKTKFKWIIEFIQKIHKVGIITTVKRIYINIAALNVAII